MNPLTRYLTFTLLFAVVASPAIGVPAEIFYGPTGITGTHNGNQITVLKVERGSPAFGKVTAKDVIVGVNGKLFKQNVRKEMAAAIEHAESPAGKGVLALILKGTPRIAEAPQPKVGQEGVLELEDADAGKRFPATHAVRISLEVLGRYADTAPYNCELTDRIVTRTADWMVKTGNYKDGQLAVGWLGLLATGEQKYLDVVKRELPKEQWYTPDREKFEALLRGETDMGYVGWRWGYQAIVLAEYYLLTGDKSARPGLETIAVTLAKGQDPAGRWGHRMISEERGGRLPGYAHINQPSLTCLLGILLARECGIEHPAIDKAIERSHIAFSMYVGEGALPYGNHPPNSRTYNNNGSSATAGLAMSFIGDKKAADFFARQSATSYDGMETGHASYIFNVMWTPVGAHLAGPEVTRQYFDKTRWFHTLARDWNGRFTWYGGEAKAHNSSGSALMTYCLGRRALLITGRDADRSLWVDRDEATSIINLSRVDVAGKGTDELIDLLDHPAPQIRRQAGWLLRERPPQFVPQLVELMNSGTKLEKLSAIGFFGYKCPEAIGKANLANLGRVLRNTKEDPQVRAAAASSLAFYGESSYAYFEDMLRLLAEDRPGDKLLEVDATLGEALVRLGDQPFNKGLVEDKSLFYRAVLKLADHPLQSGRGNAMRLLIGMPTEDFPIVGRKVLHVAYNRDRSYTSYHNPMSAVQHAVLVLAQFDIAEGIDIAWATLETPDGKFGFKARAILSMLAAYGPHAKPSLDKINGDPDLKRGMTAGRWRGLYDNLVKAANDTTPRPPLISFDQAMNRRTDG